MAWKHPLTVEVDVPEPRVLQPRYVFGIECPSIDLAYSSDTVMLEPVTGMGMLRPIPLTDAWSTTFSNTPGNKYYRYKEIDYVPPTGTVTYNDPTTGSPITAPASSFWMETDGNGLYDRYVESLGNYQKRITDLPLVDNQPMFIQAWVGGVKSNNRKEIISCDYNYDAGTSTYGVRFIIFNDGSVDIYRNGFKSGTYERTEGNLKSGRAVTLKYMDNQSFINFMILPCRRREVLFLSNFGTAFCHAFTELDEKQLDNVILPAGQFAWEVYSPFHIKVQIAQVQFETSGLFMSPIITARTIIPTLGSETSIFTGDHLGPDDIVTPLNYSIDLYETDGITPFVNFNGTDQLRIGVTLTGGGKNTLTLYAGDLHSETVIDSTADEPVDITTALESLTMSVRENGRTEMKMTARRKRLLDLGVQQPTVTCDRPIRIKVGDVDIFRGVLSAPQVGYTEGDNNLDWSTISFDGFDRTMEFQQCFLLDSLPYDDYNLKTAIEDLLEIAGYVSTDYSIDATNLDLPRSATISQGEWLLAPERGDYVITWLDKLWENYAQTWFRGWQPTLSGYQYVWRDPNNFSNTPVTTLYMSTQDAITAGLSMDGAIRRVARQINGHVELPEANHVQIIGRNLRIKSLVMGNYNDTLSQEPYTSPADRPYNWRGRVVTVVHINPDINDEQSMNDTLEIFKTRVTTGRRIIEWESDFLIDNTTNRPFWISDVVRIMKPGGTDSFGDYRIIEIPEIEFVTERDDVGQTGFSVRRAKYVAVNLDWYLGQAEIDSGATVTAIGTVV